ncbi:MAG: hypothetical protein ACXAC2_07165 [Candidatus Kariarchaeaceae archaeon]
MSSGIARIRSNKFFPYLVILYIAYLIILFLLIIPYLPELIEIFSKTEISSDELYQTPLVPLGIAALIPLAVIYLVVDYKIIINTILGMVTPFKELDRRILGFTIIYLLIQLVFNSILVFILVLVVPDLYDISSYSPESALLIWLIGCISSLVIIILNTLISWKWVKTGMKQPNGLHWLIGYMIYIVAVSTVLLVVETIDTSLKGFILWPFTGIVIIGALSYFIVSFGLFIYGLEVVLEPYRLGQGDAALTFAFTVGTLFMLISTVLLFIHLLNFYLGVFFANWQNRNRNDKSSLV